MALSIGELVGYVSLDTSQAEKGSAEVEGIFGKLGGKLKAGLAGVGLMAGTALIGGVIQGMDNEAASDKLAASLGKGSKEAERLGDIAGRVYSNGFGAGMEDVNTAIGAVVSSIKGMRNASDADVQAMTERAMTYADVMGIDVTRAAQVAGNMVANGLAKNGKQAFDLLMKTSQKVPVQLREDILDATDEYGQFFTMLGIDGPQAMGMLAAGAKKGMYGIDKAGDAVKEFTIRATDMSTASVDAYDTIGLNAQKMSNDILAGGNRAEKATGKIIDGLLGIQDPAKRANTSIALFGTPLEDLSTKDIPVFLRSLKNGEKSLGNFRGSVAKAGKTAYDNAKSNLTVFWRTIKTGFVDFIGGKALPVVNKLASELATNLRPAVEAVGKWVREKLMPALREAGETVLPKLRSAAGDVGEAFRSAAPFFKLLGKILTEVVLPVAAKLLGVTWPAMAKVLLVVGKVVGRVGEQFTKGFGQIKSAAKAVGSFFSKTVPSFFTKAWDKIKSTTSSGASKVVGFFRAMPGRAKGALSNLAGAVGGAFASAMNAGKAKVTGIGSTILGWIREIPGKIKSLGGLMGAAGKAILQQFIDGMKNAAGIIAGIAGNVWDTVRGLLNGAIDRINAALEFTIDPPGPGQVHVNPSNIPHLATGGRATRETLAVIGEGREPESVLPDSVLRGLLERAHDAGKAIAQAGQGKGYSGPLIGQLHTHQADPNLIAEGLWYKTRTRG